jgi:hypothetical protein
LTTFTVGVLTGVRQGRQAVEGAALLEGSRELQVFELQPDRAAQDRGECAAPVAVGLDDGAEEPPARRLDRFERDG